MKKDERPAMDMEERARSWYRLSDGTVRMLLAQEGSPVPTCQKGCSACCSQMTLVSLPEGVTLASFLLEKEQKGLLRDFKSNLSETLEKLKLLGASHTTWPERRQAWFEANQPCLLLSKKGLCRAYDVRPTACRLYFVASDPALCAVRPVAEVQQLDLREEQARSFAAMKKVTLAEELPMVAAPLPVAVAWGFRLKTAGFRAFKEWFEALDADHVLSPAFWVKAMDALSFK